MRISSRFHLCKPYQCIVSLMFEGNTSFKEVTVIGKDVSQSGKERLLVVFHTMGAVRVALVYPYLPLISVYKGGYGKRYGDTTMLPQWLADYIRLRIAA